MLNNENYTNTTNDYNYNRIIMIFWITQMLMLLLAAEVLHCDVNLTQLFIMLNANLTSTALGVIAAYVHNEF